MTSRLLRRAFPALIFLFAPLWRGAHAAADPWADLVVSGPAGAENALGACDGVAVNITNSELIVAFADDYLLNPDNGPALDGRAYWLASEGCDPSFAFASSVGPPYFDWAQLGDDDISRTLSDQGVAAGPSGLACAGTVPRTAP